jgi:hypothetical protein
MNQHVATETIERRIFVIRGKRVMLDRDLAGLYGVETRALNQAVRRNFRRFPEDFMFQLTGEEWDSLRSRFVILKSGRGQHLKYMPSAFTEHGVVMLSSVLNSEKATDVNILVVRAFVRMREIALQNHEIWAAIQKIEKHLEGHDMQIRVAFDALKGVMGAKPTPLLLPPEKLYSANEKKRMGFGPGKKEGRRR